MTAVRTAEGGTRVTASEPSVEVVRRREVETQAVAAAGGGGRGGSTTARRGVPVAGAVLYPAEGVSLPRIVAPGGFAGGTGTVNKEDLGTQVIEGARRHGHAHDDDHCRWVDWQRAADPDRVRAVVLAGSRRCSS